MLDIVLQYRINAKESKLLCKELETLKIELEQAGDIIKPDLHHYLFFKIESIKEELNELWDAQIELYHQIHNYD